MPFAFGILSSRFRMFHEAMLVNPDKVKDIVLACEVVVFGQRGTWGMGRYPVT